MPRVACLTRASEPERQKVQTAEERRAARIVAMKDHSFRCGVLVAMATQTLPTLASALAQLRRHNRNGANDLFISELERVIKSVEGTLDDIDEADREVNQRLGLSSWRDA